MSGWGYVRERALVADSVIGLVATLLALGCLIPLYSDLAWIAPAVVVATTVAALGVSCRAIAMPLPLIPLAQLIGIVIALTVLFVSEAAYSKVLPTSDSSDALRALLAQGMADAQAFATPVPTVPTLVLLGAGVAGLLALSVDTLFVSVRSPVAAGAPIAAAYLGSTLLQFGKGETWVWWSFTLAAVAWLLILAADQRAQVRQWGRLSNAVRIRGLSRAARRTGILAIVAAAAVGIVLPLRAAAGLTGSGTGAGAGAADGAVILDPLVSMRRDLTLANDVEVIRYRTSSPEPAYLRVTALENFDGVTWRQRPGLESGRDPGWQVPGILQSPSDATLSTYDISVTNLDNSYLPLPYPVAEVQNIEGIGSGWRFDPATGVAFSLDRAATGTNYRVSAIEPVVDATALRNAPLPTGTLWPQLSLPNSISPTIRQVAQQVSAGASTPYDKALALQKWFTNDGGFRYSTAVRSGSDLDYITEFLRDRVGYCEQFAGAMAIMARTLGIPSRVVVGFTQGSESDDGSWKVTARDAHAWPELWFDGVGWVRFEPTPRTGATVRTPDYAPTAGQVPDEAAIGAEERRFRADLDPIDQATIDRQPDLRAAGKRLALISVALISLTVVLLPMCRRIINRRRRLHRRDLGNAVAGAWEEISATAIDLRLPWSPFVTPRQAAQRLARGMSEPASAALRRLRVQVEQVRYGPGPIAGSQELSAAVRSDVAIVVRALRDRVRWQVRFEACYWPPSERRRHRSSIRSMNPEDLRDREAAGGFAAASSSVVRRVRKAE